MHRRADHDHSGLLWPLCGAVFVLASSAAHLEAVLMLQQLGAGDTAAEYISGEVRSSPCVH